MLTAFDLLQLLGILAGIATGLSIGHACFGWVGAAVGGVLGLLAGYLVGRLPWLIAWGIFRFRIKSTSTERLRKRLETQYFISHLLIAEIVVRGEPAESFWPYSPVAAAFGFVRSAAFRMAEPPDLVPPACQTGRGVQSGRPGGETQRTAQEDRGSRTMR